MSPVTSVSHAPLRRELQSLRTVGGLLIIATLLIQFRGQPRMLVILTISLPLLAIFNVVGINWLERRVGFSWAEVVRGTVNAATIGVLGHLTHWSVVLWLFVPFYMLWFQGEGGWERIRAFAYLSCVDALALLDGCDPLLPLGFTVLGGITFLVTDRRTTRHQEILRELLAQREQLQQAHQRALEQEKLSSLGLMAAGVAHEINNPMSFVTSNVSSLFKELQRQQGLPEPLREYVAEVLPDNRVAAPE